MALIFGNTTTTPSESPSQVTLVATSDVTHAQLGLEYGQTLLISTPNGNVPAVLITDGVEVRTNDNIEVLVFGIASTDLADVINRQGTVSINGVRCTFQFQGYENHSYDAFNAGIESEDIYDFVYSYAVYGDDAYQSISL